MKTPTVPKRPSRSSGSLRNSIVRVLNRPQLVGDAGLEISTFDNPSADDKIQVLRCMNPSFGAGGGTGPRGLRGVMKDWKRVAIGQLELDILVISFVVSLLLTCSL